MRAITCRLTLLQASLPLSERSMLALSCGYRSLLETTPRALLMKLGSRKAAPRGAEGAWWSVEALRDSFYALS